MIRRPPLLRRTLGAAAAAGVAVLTLAPTVWAADSREVTSGPFQGSKILTTASPVAVADNRLEAIIKIPNLFAYQPVTVGFERAPGIPSACTMTKGAVTGAQTNPGGKPFFVDTSVSCNGAYPYTFDTYITGITGRTDMPQLRGTLIVEVAPGAVPSVSASADASRTVSVSWTASPSESAPDFEGYLVQRRLGSGSWENVIRTSATASSASDTDVPLAAGDYTYRVLARRAGVGDDVISAQGGTDTVSLAAGDPTTTTTVGDGTDPTVPGGGTPGGTTDGTGPDGTTVTTRKGYTPARPRAGVGVGVIAPRLGAPTQSNLGVLLTPTTVDEGFSEDLPFGELPDESEDGSLADDSSSLFYEGGSGRGMAVPVATGFVLFAWAIHLRFLARASRPEGAAGADHFDYDPFDPFYDPM